MYFLRSQIRHFRKKQLQIQNTSIKILSIFSQVREGSRSHLQKIYQDLMSGWEIYPLNRFFNGGDLDW